MPHPVLWISWIVSALWFFAVALMAKRHVGAALVYALLGPLVWMAVALSINVIPKLIPFAGLPLLTFMDMRYFFFLDVIPSAAIVFWLGLQLKRTITDSSSQLSRYGRRSETVAAPKSEDTETRTAGLDVRTLMQSVAVVTVLYVIGSALSYGLEDDLAFLNVTDFRWPMHLGTLVGFALVAPSFKRRLLLSFGIVFVCSYLLTGIYEELWRRIVWGAGYDWGYHVWTLPEWLVSFVIGAVLGRTLAKRSWRRS
jgi:hypothetical protein